MKLSRLQITKLLLLFKEAFARVAGQARARGEEFDDGHESFDQWRRSQVFAACGRHGLSVATNDDYRKIHSRALCLLGEDGAAMNDLLAADTEKVRQLRFVIQRELTAAHLPENYATAIALDKFRRPLDDLDELQLRQMVVTIKSRITARRRQTAGSPHTSPLSPHTS